MRRHLVVTVILLTIAASPAVMQEKGGVDLTGPYDVVPNWLKPVSPGRLLYPIAVFAASPDRIFIGSVGTAPMPANGIKPYGNFRPNAPGAKVDHQVIVVDRNGALVENWSQWSELFGSPHRVTINPYDPDKHVWVIDRASQQLLKFTNDGKRLVMTVGERGVAGEDDKHFGRPTGIAWLPDGTFFVSDGYDNARVVKFDKTGKFLTSWGRKGTAPGEFNGVHAISVDAERRVYVVDRNNARIQIFDEHGKFLDQWPNFSSPTQIVVTQDQFVWVSDGGVGGRGGANRLLKYDKNGKLLTYWGTQGTFPGAMAGPHDFHVDSEGNLYVSNGLDQRVDKYVPRKSAEPGRLMKQSFK